MNIHGLCHSSRTNYKLQAKIRTCLLPIFLIYCFCNVTLYYVNINLKTCINSTILFISSLSLCFNCVTWLRSIRKPTLFCRRSIAYLFISHVVSASAWHRQNDLTFCSVQWKCLLIIKVHAYVLSSQYTNRILTIMKETNKSEAR
jgi:hypothetical protein